MLLELNFSSDLAAAAAGHYFFILSQWELLLGAAEMWQGNGSQMMPRVHLWGIWTLLIITFKGGPPLGQGVGKNIIQLIRNLSE